MGRISRFFRSGLMSGTGVLVVGVAFFAVPSPAGHAGTGCHDCYVVTPAASPATAGAGTGGRYTFAVTNHDGGETLRTLTFTAPAHFVISGASGPRGTSVSALPASSLTLHLPRDAGTAFTIGVTALTPCLTASSENWAVSGTDTLERANEVKWSSSPLSVLVTGQCRLAFTGEPAETAANSGIRTGFNSTGSPLAVHLLNADNDVLHSANGTPVTVSVGASPGGGTLTGTTTVASSKGGAEFGNLRINKPGAAYDLAASAPGFAKATSSYFTIAGKIQACGAGSCSVSQSTSATAASLTARPSTSGDFATLGLGGVNLTCNHYDAVSDAADFGVFSSSGSSVTDSPAIVTLTISSPAVKPESHLLFRSQVCYASPEPFPAIFGTAGTTTIGSTTYHTGLLLPCFAFGPRHDEPCLISRHQAKEGTVELTFAALGDPVARG